MELCRYYFEELYSMRDREPLRADSRYLVYECSSERFSGPISSESPPPREP